MFPFYCMFMLQNVHISCSHNDNIVIVFQEHLIIA